MSSLRKRNSKTLTRNNSQLTFRGFYHDTETLTFDRVKNIVTFRNGSWVTISTNKSQEFFLEDIGLTNLKIGMKSGKPTLLDKNLKQIMVLEDETKIPMNHLRIWNDGGTINV